MTDPPDPSHWQGLAALNPWHLTDRQLAVLTYQRMIQLEARMTEMTQALTDLQTAVDGVAQRLLPQIETLKAERDSLSAQAQNAIDVIEGQVQELNSLGANPQTPVEPTP